MQQVWTEDDLEKYWRLDVDEEELAQRVHERLRLGFALQLRFLDYVGRFPHHRGEIPVAVAGFLAATLNVEITSLSTYPWLGGRTLKRHRAIARTYLGYRPAAVEDAAALKDYLLEYVTPRELRPAVGQLLDTGCC